MKVVKTAARTELAGDGAIPKRSLADRINDMNPEERDGCFDSGCINPIVKREVIQHYWFCHYLFRSREHKRTTDD